MHRELEPGASVAVRFKLAAVAAARRLDRLAAQHFRAFVHDWRRNRHRVPVRLPAVIAIFCGRRVSVLLQHRAVVLEHVADALSGLAGRGLQNYAERR